MQIKIKKPAHLFLLCQVGLVLLLALGMATALIWRATTRTVQPPTEPTEPPEPTLTANPYGPEDFAVENGYMTCLTGKSVLGIDVSTFQQNVDWQQVKAAGVEFVMIRLGHRGTNIGVLFEDELVQSHYAGASAAGLKVGGYFFSQAITPEEAVEEAEFALQIIQDWQVDMPIVFDWEHIDNDCRTTGMDARTLTDCAKAFCDRIKAEGYRPMVYFNANQAANLLYLLELEDYDFWLAMYHDQMDFPHRVDMWQYTQTGAVPGIPGNVDINLYLPYA